MNKLKDNYQSVTADLLHKTGWNHQTKCGFLADGELNTKCITMCDKSHNK